MRRYKYIISAIFCLVLMLCMSACKKTISNRLMQNASPATSALTLYTYDGEKICRAYIYDDTKTQSILDELDAVKATEAKNWSLEDITLPIYGLSIWSKDGESILMAWTNGYWISQDGTAYRFDYDFAKLEQDEAWTDKDVLSSFSSFPCARILSQDETGWNPTLLTPAETPNPPAGITMTLKKWEDSAITMNFANESGTEWAYGAYYYLHVLLDDVWYEIPAAKGDWGFIDIGYGLPDGGEQDMTYDLTMYGDLPAGKYRLAAYDLSVEFIVEP